MAKDGDPPRPTPRRFTMARTHSSIALDSEQALRKAVGPDATAAFESDPNFIPSDPTATASSENIALQPDTEEEDTDAEDLDEQDEDDELEDEDDDDEDEEDEEDDDEDDVEDGVDEDEPDDDDLDTDQVTDAALGLNPYLRIAPSTSARAAHQAGPLAQICLG